RVDPANAAAPGVHVEHHLGRLLQVHGKKAHQDLDHEVHRGVVVIEQQDRVERRTCHFGLAGLHQHAMVAFVFVASCHPPIIWTPRPAGRTMGPMSYREGRFWQPDVTVATVVVADGRMLMVEESVAGQLVLNQPAGHLEPDESLFEAALRETREETGWDVRLTAFVGAYQWRAPSQGGEQG